MDPYVEERMAALAPLTAAMAGGGGEDLTFDPDFEAVKAEIDKMSAVSGETPDWRKVQDSSKRLLSERTKDFRLACWFAAASVKTGDWEGLADGLIVLRGLSMELWDAMHPPAKRARGRAALFDWFSELTLEALEGSEVGRRDRDTVKACRDVLPDLDNVLSEKLGDAFAGCHRLRNMISDKVRALPPPTPPPPPPSEREESTEEEPQYEVRDEPEEEPQEIVPQGVSLPENFGSAWEALEALPHYANALLRVATAMRREDLADVRAYRILRAAIWLPFDGAPPNENGITQVPAPNPALRFELSECASRNAWHELVERGETAISENPLWFDLQRDVAYGLERLAQEDSRFLDARRLVIVETLSVLERLNPVRWLKYSNGQPFVESATQEWLGAEARVLKPSGGDASEFRQRAEYRMARDKLEAGDPVAALTLASGAAAKAADGRSKVAAHIELAKLALDAGAIPLAMSVLRPHYQEIVKRDLGAWDPALTTAVFTTLIHVVRRAREADLGVPVADGGAEPTIPDGTFVDLGRFEAVLLDKVGRLDPALALQLARGES